MHGAALAAAVGLPVISDLRMMDVALGGQGAPIVPIGDKLLFGEYDYLLNIGGIANLTVNNGGNFTAFDVCPANLVLNLLAAREGLDMDEDGILASSGRCMERVLDALDGQGYYSAAPPKSLSNSQAVELVFPKLLESSHSTADQLLTVVRHIVGQVGKAVASFPVLSVGQPRRMLVTGGGAFNKFLIAQLAALLAEQGVEVVVPDAPTVKFKEALVMALIGVLRWRGEVNVLASVTGARQDSIGGAVWMV